MLTPLYHQKSPHDCFDERSVLRHISCYSVSLVHSLVHISEHCGVLVGRRSLGVIFQAESRPER